MIKKIIFLFFIFNINVFAFELTKIRGETSYSKSSTESLNTSLIFEYNIKIYEPKHKKWELHISGKLNPCYDHFGNEIKMDAFTVLGIGF
jgi:hypothetical protein